MEICVCLEPGWTRWDCTADHGWDDLSHSFHVALYFWLGPDVEFDGADIPF